MLAGTVTALTVTAAFSQRHHPQQETPPTQQQPAPEQRGTEQAPFVVQIQNHASHTEEESNRNTENGIQNLSNSWGRSDVISASAAIAGFLQFVALAVTIGVLIFTARRQLRAYIFPESAGLFEGMMMQPPRPEHTNEPGVILLWKNTGQTPARDVISWGQIAVIETIHEESLLVVSHLEKKFANSLGTNGINSKAIWYGRALADNEIKDIGTGIRAIYLYGRIEYRDIFKKQRWTNFRLRYAGQFPPPPEGVVFTTSEKGNDAN